MMVENRTWTSYLQQNQYDHIWLTRGSPNSKKCSVLCWIHIHLTVRKGKKKDPSSCILCYFIQKVYLLIQSCVTTRYSRHDSLLKKNKKSSSSLHSMRCIHRRNTQQQYRKKPRSHNPKKQRSGLANNQTKDGQSTRSLTKA